MARARALESEYNTQKCLPHHIIYKLIALYIETSKKAYDNLSLFGKHDERHEFAVGSKALLPMADEQGRKHFFQRRSASARRRQCKTAIYCFCTVSKSPS